MLCGHCACLPQAGLKKHKVIEILKLIIKPPSCMELFSESRGVPLCGTLLYSVVKKIRQRWDLRFVIRDLRFEIGGIGELGNWGIGESGNRGIGNR